MKNAILSALTTVFLGATVLLGGFGLCASPAVAQTDDAETPDEGTPETGEPAEGDDTSDDAGEATEGDAGETGDAETGDAETGEAEGGDSGETGAGGGDAEGEPAEAGEELESPDADPEPEVSEPEAPETTEPVEETSSGLASPEEAAEGSVEEAGDEAAEEPAEEPAEEEEAPSGPEPLPWRNTFFTWTNQATFNSFLRDAQLSYNPVYQQSFSLAPRWYIGPMTQIRGSLSLSLEITDTDGNALNRDPQIGDPTLSLLHLIPWEGFIFMPSVRLAFPVSKSSQAAQRYFQAGAGLTLVRIIPEVANLTLAGVFRYSRWFAGSNVVRVGAPQPDRCGGPAPPVTTGADPAPQITTAFCDQLGTTSAASDIILAGISATMTPVGGFSINLSAFLYTLHGFGLAPWTSEPGQVLTREDNDPIVIEDGSPSHWRNFTYISIAVAYQFTPWLNMSLGIQNSGNVASAWNPDGSVRNPLFTPDTQVFLSATFGVDTIYNELFGAEEEELTPEERQRRQQGLASGPSVGGTF